MDGIQGTRGGVWMELGGGSGLGRHGDMTEGQGIMEDMTFHDSGRDMSRPGTWRDEDGDVKAW
jgi:hypothetical protein